MLFFNTELVHVYSNILNLGHVKVTRLLMKDGSTNKASSLSMK